MFRKIGAVILLVSDMRRSINFYKNTLGLPLKSRSKDWTEFIQDGTVLALHPARKKFRPKSKQKVGMLIGFKVGNIDEVYKALKRKRVKFMKEPLLEHFGKHAVILDPDGHMISIIEFKISKEEELQPALWYHGFTPI